MFNPMWAARVRFFGGLRSVHHFRCVRFQLLTLAGSWAEARAVEVQCGQRSMRNEAKL